MDKSDQSDLSENTKKPPENLTRAFLLKDGEIFWLALSAKISAAFLILQAGTIGRNPAESGVFEGFSHFFRLLLVKIFLSILVGFLIVSAGFLILSADAIRESASSLIVSARRKGELFALSLLCAD
ncbi:hypothetical protein [Alloprevotella rava]|uniref:Uncharacterized protein n=1 Tax=Alloprevotella rava TaxID=671218 RepID=A0A7W5UIS4_9BACT|nr:hypothetical protein [Alloprevotella rava]MBB3702178.1 hypothetical protein [Alloprevotella rava]